GRPPPGPGGTGGRGVTAETEPPGPPPGAASAPAAPQATAAPAAARAPRVLPPIRLVDGQLPRTVEAIERAMISADMEIFSRASELVYPASEARPAANGRKTITARLSTFSADSFIEPVAEAAIYQRWSVRRNAWVDIDPPLQL